MPSPTCMHILVEIVALAIMVIGVIGIFIERARTKRGIGVRVIQFATVLLVLPIVLVLAVERILESQTVATLIGAIVGYILSGIGKDEPQKDSI